MAAKKDDALTREGAGNWRTKDGRFLIRGESGGHWYLIDDLRRDPFGLELVSGPYATVAAAREAIARARAEFPEGSGAPVLPPPPDVVAPDVAPSPAASKRGRPAAARRQPGPADGQRLAPAPAAPATPAIPAEEPGEAPGKRNVEAPKKARPHAPGKAPEMAAVTKAAPVKARDAAPEPPKPRAATEPAPPAAAPLPAAAEPATVEPAPPATVEPAAEQPREQAWMDALPPAGRRVARTMLEVLDQLGVEDAGDIVRRDLATDVPEVVRAMLLQRVAAIIGEAPDPAAARAIVADVLRLLTVAGRADDRARGIPGWYLVESRTDRTDRSGRPIVLEASDLDAALDGGLDDASERRTLPGR